MKAVIRNKYGGGKNLQVVDTPTPQIKENHVLVKVHAASLNKLDVHLLQGKPFLVRTMIGLFKPKHAIIGSDLSGEIVEVGVGVEDFKVGDEVFGVASFNQEGSFAEYCLISPKLITFKPTNVSHSQAASVGIAGITALQAARLGELKPNSHVLIYGASGGVGTFMIQIAKYYKANVTAVCSTRNVELANASGADYIIDYKKEQWDNGKKKYDIIFACNGYNKPSRYRDALVDGGTCIQSGGDSKKFIIETLKELLLKKGKRKFTSFMAKLNKKDLNTLADLLAEGILKPHIDKEFLLKNTVRAFDHFMNNQSIGKTVIKIM